MTMKVARLSALVGVAAAVALLLSGCGAGKSASTRSATATAASSGVGTPSPTPTPKAVTYVLLCTTDGQTFDRITDYRDGWKKPYRSCDAEKISGTISEAEMAAVKAMGRDDPDLVKYLYAICAETTGHYLSGNVGSAQAPYIAGALKLCPEHPKRDQFEASVKAGQAKEAEEALIMADRKNGKYVGEGKYLVGKEVVPGTWQSQGDKVEECYWEISDAQGNILANNFINVAPQFTIYIPPTAAGFTVTNCSFRWIGG